MKDNIGKIIKTIVNNPGNIPWRGFQFARRIFPLDYYFASGHAFPPDIITILITRRCNFSCPGCSSASPLYTKDCADKKEMSLEEIKKLIDQVAWFKPAIYFNGGEPTLRPDLIEAIKYAKSKGLITALTTNGSLMDEDLTAKIVSSGLDFYSTSIDGPAEYHNARRGFTFAYENATRGIINLLLARKKAGVATPHIRISCITNSEKVDYNWHVLHLANDLGTDEVAFGNLMFYSPEVEKKQNDFIAAHGTGGQEVIGLAVNDGKIAVDAPALKEFYRTAKQKSKIPVYLVLNEGDVDSFYSWRYPAKSRCLTPWLVAVVLPNGDVTVCQNLILGNILQDKFTKIWNNKKFKYFRLARKKYQMPACFRCIEGQEIKFD
ncbi:MAG: radical SAM protein [Patescibacteria group bacterium]|jgi:MoaA/NifB/PqqE/SkfB family radical SAM enzyme